MDNNIKNLLSSELYSATIYTNRIFDTILSLPEIKNLPQTKKIGSKFFNEIINCLRKKITLITPETEKDLSLKKVYQQITDSTKIIESLINLDVLDMSNKEIISLFVDYINTLYRYDRDLHQLCANFCLIDIERPRLNITEMESFEENTIPRYFLTLKNILQSQNNQFGTISSLHWQREKQYKSLIDSGQKLVFTKKYEQALTDFIKASHYRETAEVLTLTGLAYSMLNQADKAKSYCLKAIKKDPDYGPAYNDLGSYLLMEGNVDESIKWFELAKTALHYQNREYPFINAGRAWIRKKNLNKALEEFSAALTLAPYHEDLHHTIETLKGSSLLNKKNPNKLTELQNE